MVVDSGSTLTVRTKVHSLLTNFVVLISSQQHQQRTHTTAAHQLLCSNQFLELNVFVCITSASPSVNSMMTISGVEDISLPFAWRQWSVHVCECVCVCLWQQLQLLSAVKRRPSPFCRLESQTVSVCVFISVFLAFSLSLSASFSLAWLLLLLLIFCLCWCFIYLVSYLVSCRFDVTFRCVCVCVYLSACHVLCCPPSPPLFWWWLCSSSRAHY